MIAILRTAYKNTIYDIPYSIVTVKNSCMSYSPLLFITRDALDRPYSCLFFNK